MENTQNKNKNNPDLQANTNTKIADTNKEEEIHIIIVNNNNEQNPKSLLSPNPKLEKSLIENHLIMNSEQRKLINDIPNQEENKKDILDNNKKPIIQSPSKDEELLFLIDDSNNKLEIDNLHKSGQIENNNTSKTLQFNTNTPQNESISGIPNIRIKEDLIKSTDLKINDNASEINDINLIYPNIAPTEIDKTTKDQKYMEIMNSLEETNKTTKNISDGHTINNNIDFTSITSSVKNSETIKPTQMHNSSFDSPSNICLICFNTYDKTSRAKALSCGHEFCLSCVQEYLNNKIDINKINDIFCPQESCKAIYTENDIKSIVNEIYFTKFVKFKTKNMINTSKDMKWCINPNCEKAVKIKPGQIKLICECGTIFCVKCNHEWHEGKPCQVVIDKDFENYAKSHEILACPLCKNATEKSYGCNHMTCSICGYEWCWLCKSEYIPGHYSTMNPFGCPGLQGGRYDRVTCNILARYGLKIGICLLWVLWIILVPFCILGLSIIWPILLSQKNRGFVGKSKCRVSLESFGLLIIGLITFPITFVILLTLAIVPGICISISRLLKKRKRLRAIIRGRRNHNIIHQPANNNNNNNNVANIIANNELILVRLQD